MGAKSRFMGKLTNKVVVVTGGASGIGLAICHRFAREGAKIALLDLDDQAITARCQELQAQGVEAFGRRCDVSVEADCSEAAQAILDHFGGVDVLVNNAGITQRAAFVDTQVSVFERVMAVNFFGSLYCTKAFIDSLIERRGQVIVIESIAGVAPLLGRTGYAASKHALHGLFTSLRTELRAQGTHVMIVCPGFIKTNLQTRALGGDGQVTDHPQSFIGKQSTPEEAAEAIVQGAIKRKHMVVLTVAGKLGYWISRVAPVLYERIIERKFKAELER